MLCSQKERVLQELGNGEGKKTKERKLFVFMDQDQTFVLKEPRRGFSLGLLVPSFKNK